MSMMNAQDSLPAGLAELVGGLLIAAGLFTRPASCLLACTMGVAALMQHAADPLFSRTGPSKEMAVLYLVAAIAFALAGSGRWGIDALLRRMLGSASEPHEARD